MLADRAGIRITASDGHARRGGRPRRLGSLYQAMAWAPQQYHDFLCSTAKRRPRPDSILRSEDFRREHRALQPGFRIERLGLIRKARATTFIRQGAGKRLSQPLAKSAVVSWLTAFGAVSCFRLSTCKVPRGFKAAFLPSLAAEGTAKYINSPETPLFSKKPLLYGLAAAREAIRKPAWRAGHGRLHRLPDGASVRPLRHAVLGTAIGSQQIRLLRRAGRSAAIVLVLDGDEAGKRRQRNFASCSWRRTSIFACSSPDDLDPCEFLLRARIRSAGEAGR